MIALLRKDLDWLAFFALGGTVLLMGILLDMRLERTWILPGDEVFWYCFHAWWPLGCGLGLFAALRDEVPGTEEYLRHRPVSAKRIVDAKIVGCLVVLGIWLVLPFLLQLAFLAPWSRGELGVARFARAPQYLGMGMLAVASFASAFFAASLRAAWVTRFVAAACGQLILIWVALRIAEGPGEGERASMLCYVLVLGALSLAFLWAARRQCVALRDPDRALEPGQVRSAFGLLLVTGLAATTLALASLQAEIESQLMGTYPRVAKLESGAVRLVAWDSERQASVFTDEAHVKDRSEAGIVGERLRSFGPFRHTADPFRGLRHERFDGESFAAGRSQRGGREGVLRQPEGIVYVYEHLWTVRKPRLHRLTRNATGGGFSSRARPVNADHWGSALYIADPEDGSLHWVDLDGDELALREIPLPNGDRYVSHRHAHAPQSENKRTESQPWREKRRLIVVGKDDEYLVEGGSAKVLPAAWRKPGNDERGWESVASVVDPVVPAVSLRAPDGEVVFEHDYAPRTGEEKRTALLLYATGFLRAPLLQCASFVSAAPEKMVELYRSFAIDPLLAGGKRAWYLALHLLFAAGLALHTFARLRELGATRARLAFWTVVVVAGGVLAWSLCLATETKRAWRDLGTDADAPPPLIVS